jgi:uncharacterized protein (UPF0276 family)
MWATPARKVNNKLKIMKFAINYSTQAAELFSKDEIRIDYFKCPGDQELVAQARAHARVVVHFNNLAAGSGKVENVDWNGITELLDETGTLFVNVHLAPYVADTPDVPPDGPTQAQASRIIEKLLRDVRTLASRFGPERVILENVPYHGSDGNTIRTGAEPPVISQIIQETGCGFLLDISHARIAARHLEMDERDYMLALPCHRLQELHFTGLHQVNGKWVDHLPVLDDDWLMLEWVIERIQLGEWAHPWLLTLEYGGVGEKYAERSDPQVIADQVPRLRKIINRV